MFRACLCAFAPLREKVLFEQVPMSQPKLSILCVALLALAATRSARVRAFVVETRDRLKGPDIWIAWLMSLASWPAQVAAYGLGAMAMIVV